MISVCIITKHEKDKLDRAIKTLADYPVEAVVVDTGSQDGAQAMLEGWQRRRIRT